MIEEKLGNLSSLRSSLNHEIRKKKKKEEEEKEEKPTKEEKEGKNMTENKSSNKY